MQIRRPPCRPRPLVLVLVAGLLAVRLGRGGRGGAPAAVAGAAGIGDPYFPLDGNGGYDVAHYDVHDTYAVRRPARLSGRTRSRRAGDRAISQLRPRPRARRSDR